MAGHQQALRQLDFKPYLQKSDGLAWQSLVVNYALIVLAFAMPVLWLNPLTVVLSIILLGNRQLGLGILMHDCVHGALFKTPALNKWAGTYLCATPILAQFEGYRQYHLKHHAKAGTTDDPDYPNYQHYPVSGASLRRKALRDLVGITGLKNLYILLLMHAGWVDYDMSYRTHQRQHKPGPKQVLLNLLRNLMPSLLFHVALFLALWTLQAGPLYVLWWVAYLTTFQLFSRIRNAAEHAGVPDLLDVDPRLHARTVYARWWEKLTVAPNDVNYHLEHHWLPAVPPYRLAAFHGFLKQAGLLDQTPVLNGYGEVIRALLAKPSAASG